MPETFDEKTVRGRADERDDAGCVQRGPRATSAL